MSYKRSLQERLLALALAGVTTFSLVPTQALAEVADELTSPQDVAAQVAAVDDSGEEGAELGEPSAEPEGSAAADDGADAGIAAGETNEPQAADTDSAAMGEEPAEDSADTANEDPYAISVASSSVTVDSVDIVNESSQNLTYANRTAKVGDTIKVAAYYEDDWGDDEEITSSEYAQLTYQWYVGDKQSAAFTASSYTAIDGATSRELALTSDLAGRYVACRVTYGTKSYEYKDTASLKNAIEGQKETEPEQTEDQKTLAAAVAKAKSVSYTGWYPAPTYGTDTNICDMLSAKLADWGYKGIAVSLQSVSFSASDPAQQGGIADDGAIAYFFLSPADKTTTYDYSVLRQFTPTYKLTLGDATATYTPGRTSTLAWDDDAVEAYLSAQLSSAEFGATVKSGTADAAATEETLPSTLYANGKKVAQITWSSSNASAAKVTSSYDSNWNSVYKVAYTHGNAAVDVTLTATVTMSGASGLSSRSLTKSYAVKVDPKSAEQIAAEQKELEDALDAIDGKVVAYEDSSRSVDLASVEEDFVLPRASKILRGASIKYAMKGDSSALSLNGYHGVVTRDVEGGTNTAVITATLTKNGLTATRDITVSIKPIDSTEIDAAVAQMEAVKADYAHALLGSNESASQVSSDLSPWSSAVVGEDGSITYSKSYETGAIHADELPGYDSMAGTSWRTYKSSDTSVVADETLRVTQPAADTLVTVTSNLTYEKYESLAKAHPENEQLQKLVNQTVTATFRVVGTTDHTDPQISVNFELVGVDADGADEVWSNAAQQVAYGSNAAQLIEQVLDAAGLAHTSTDPAVDGYYYLSDITSADGRVLGWDQETGKYWQLFVNGGASQVSADSVALEPGDSVVLWYSAWGASIDDIGKATVKASMSFIGPDASGKNTVWAQAADAKVTSGTTAAELSVQLLDESGLTYEAYGEGASFYLSSITSSDGRKLGWDESTGKYWQLFVNGEVSQVGAGSVVLQPGDTIQWVYSAYGEKPLDGVIYNPSAPRSDDAADWSGFNNGGSTTLVNVPTPTDSASELWKVNLATDSDKWVSLGDPIIVGGYVYVTTNSQIVKVDSNGTIVARVSKGGTTSYFSRPVYADGLIISANDDGSIFAFSAQTLECVWSTPALEAPATGGKYQANSTMTVANGCVYAEFEAGAGSRGTASAGAMVCVDIATGDVKWTKATVKSGESTGEGYYWAGAAASGSDLVIGDEGGRVLLVDGATGDVKSSVSIGNNPIRATIVEAGTENGKQVYLAVGRQPATLYKIVRDGNTLSVAGTCAFGNTSTSTPAVANGKVYVGGNDSGYNGQFTVIDLASMEVESTYSTGKYAEVKASPLVSVQGDDTYVYFTCNKTPGSVLRYSQKTGEVVEIYTPSGSDAQYCTASVIADAAGNLYYTNDSGTLFALKAAAGYKVTFNTRGGSVVPAANPVQGKPMVAPSDPVREGYKFLGWYTDAAGTTAWNFSDPVASDMTLYAKWEKKSSPNPGDGESGNGNGGGGADNDNNGSSGSINLTGNGSATGASAKSALAITMNAQSMATEEEATTTSLLAGFASVTATGTSSVEGELGSASEGARGVTEDTGAASAAAGIPIWPFVGIGAAIAALIAVLATKRRKEEE
ncbi:MAG: DUF4430 domain-containing protein [Coriobacteriia bacterium]|nr:DUF4430 domain-containing protein [Coriobacteriia bacterium]